MRYCKYFIAKFNEAAFVHLDFWNICTWQLDAADCNEAIRQTLIHFYGIVQVYTASPPVVHADQIWELDHSFPIHVSWDDCQL